MIFALMLFPRSLRKTLSDEASLRDILNNSFSIVILLLGLFYCLYNIYLSTSLSEIFPLSFSKFFFGSIMLLSPLAVSKIVKHVSN